MIPNGWNLYKLEDLALVERGKFSARPRNDPKYYGGHIPFVQTGDISAAGTFLTKYSQTLNNEGLKVSKLFPKNSIFITIAANIGDTAITSFDVACPDSIVAIQSYNEKSDHFWLKNVLETFKVQLNSQATQNAQKNINLQVLRPLLIQTPPLSEQKKIARILSTWDKAIKIVEKLIENSKTQKKSLAQKILTGKQRLPGFSEPWEKIHLEDIANITMGSSPKSEFYNDTGQGLPLIQGNADIKNRRSAPRVYTSQITKTCNVGNILLSVRAPVGAIALSKHEACIGRGIASISAKDNVSIAFIYQLLMAFEPKWVQLSQGSTFDAVNSADVKKLRIMAPSSKEEQLKLSQILKIFDKATKNYSGQLIQLRKQKKSLMQQLLTGKRRVKVDS